MRVLGAWAAFSPRWQAPTQRTRKQIDVSFDSKKASVSRSRSSHRSPKSVQAPYYIPHTQLHVADVPVVDAIVILAGGQDESRMSQLPVWVERRLDACASLIQHQPSTTKILCSGGGTPHRQPVLAASGFCVFESMACASYLMGMGVSAAALLKETASYDTIGNGYFAATVHAVPRRWQTLCVVTSNFHMPRSRMIFQTVFKLVEKDFGRKTDLHFVEVSDEDVFTDDVLKARKEREQLSLRRFEEDMRGINSLCEFSEWLHDTHLCYSVSRQHEIGVPTGVSDNALASY